MRILWVKAGKLLPVDTGGRIRSFNILRHLAARNDVTLWSYYFGARDPAYEEALRRELPGAVATYAGRGRGEPGTGTITQVLDYARGLPSAVPFAVSKFTSAEVRAGIAQFLRERRPDVTICDFLAASLTMPRAAGVPTLLFQHNVESALWARQAKHEANLLKRAAFAVEAVKMRRYEISALRRFDRVIAVSEHDRRLMTAMAPQCPVDVVPTGVDVGSYGEAAGREPSGPIVLFLGSMDWEANMDGVKYFCREVWPRVRAAVPDARFRIVGRNPDPLVTRLASASVEVTGGVPSVIPHLAAAAVMVVPLRIGGGTRLKIYEAMAAGRAIVSTSVGAEGLEVHDGQDIMIADTTADFAAAVVSVLESPDLRRRLSAAASTTAARHDWSVITSRFEAVLAKAVEPKSAPVAVAGSV